MYFKASFRYNPKTQKTDWYYRLVESYRNSLYEVRQRTLLSVGFMDELSGDQIDQVQKGINDRISGQARLFNDSLVAHYVEHIYQRLLQENKIDVLRKDTGKDYETIDLNTLKNKNVREVGSEWMTLQVIKQLGIDSFLKDRHWSDEDISLALSHITSRAIFPASELKTVRFMQENSSICELTGYDVKTLTKDSLYQISKKLYKEKDNLEKYLSKTTNELFDLQDKIILYDLTNTYFEGEKRKSNLARFGRSKEKRNDCPLIVLALVVNVEGFVKYSSIYQGNMTDNETLGDIIDQLRTATSRCDSRAIVVIDAGIATEDNLSLIESKGYDYVCVSRSNLRKYKEVVGTPTITVKDKNNRDIELVRLQAKNDSEYYLKVTSSAKKFTETSMRSLFQQRFEDGLKNTAASLSKKSGVKRYDKVCERIGRLKQKYPSTHRLYKIDIEKNGKDICTSVKWEQIPQIVLEKEQEAGVYFLRSNLKEPDEKLIWTIYNCIRNIESSFRTLKTDLDLRPVFHKSDEATQAHLHLALLAYWLVNTIRFQLKRKSIKSEWREIVRIMNTQKCITTTAINNKEQIISVRRCSEPEEKVKEIYDALKFKHAPFIRKKSVVPKMTLKKNKPPPNQMFTT